jgi:hypothetical protein
MGANEPGLVVWNEWTAFRRKPRRRRQWINRALRVLRLGDKWRKEDSGR